MGFLRVHAEEDVNEEQAAYIDSLAETKEVDLEELPSETTDERD